MPRAPMDVRDEGDARAEPRRRADAAAAADDGVRADARAVADDGVGLDHREGADATSAPRRADGSIAALAWIVGAASAACARPTTASGGRSRGTGRR